MFQTQASADGSRLKNGMLMLLDLNAYSWPVFKKEINKLAVLALPMLVAQVAQVGIGFVDTVMAGGARQR